MINLQEKWLRPKDILKQLGISLSHQAKLRSQGKLNYHKYGAFVFYDVDIINQMIADGKVL